jgi:hypothetical protein
MSIRQNKIKKIEIMTTIYSDDKKSTYTLYSFFIKNTRYDVIESKGTHNYINVNKICNYRRTLGKNFKNFDEAVKNYSNAQIKLELLKIEMGL